MITRLIDTKYFPLVVEVDDGFVGDVLEVYGDQIEKQLRAIIEKSSNQDVIDYANEMLRSISDNGK